MKYKDKPLDKVSREMARKAIRNLAHENEWEQIADQREIYMMSFARGGERINIYYGRSWRLTVATVLNHPVWGRQQLYRRFIDMDELNKIFIDPRTHTGKGYYQKGAIIKMKNKKWQNLLYKQCPKCGCGLESCKDKKIFYECKTPGCEFIITRSKYAEILTDREHIMRRFITNSETILLEHTIKNLII